MKYRIIQVGKFYPPVKGGIETHLYDLCTGIKNHVSVTVLVANETCKTVVENIDGIKIIRAANLMTFKSQPICPSLPGLLMKQQADLIHLHLPNPLTMLLTSRHISNRKLVITWHSDIIRQKYLKKVFHASTISILEKADRIIVPTEFHISNSELLQDFKDKCCIIPFGTDIDRFSAIGLNPVKTIKIRNLFNNPLILFVGRLVPYKGIDILLEAISDLDVSLIIVGKGPLKNSLFNKASELGIQNRIWFTGDIPDSELPSYYHACNIFCLPSVGKNECFGIVQMEAMAAGKPVISTKLPTGIQTVNIDGETGFQVIPGSVSSLKRAIRILIENPDLAKKMGQNGLNRARNYYNRDNTAQKILDLYNTLLGESTDDTK
ncbi:MAG: hypothetical protein A2161_01195 [Candidatus Schekmanbacteria bacterium RBG_13_48_7]|uniref:Glycosyl transferase family 1 n=1 Tax=Candidatus Schekmanbacteria bacterium RBG_13_48_7 TaxID=1817878 RepID=A0A1F7RPY8_9BACT|nr:MAG: hypothetical protein A2161_01195 [Candidatus Schekmanbacteria bacterium RBG_13_48_7]